MRTTPRLVLLAGIFVLFACGNKGEDEPSAGAGDEQKQNESGDDDGESDDEPKAGAKIHFDYPPEGEGPHSAYDLAAIRDKLQGTWLVGGTGFSSIPHIWHIEGDELTLVNGKGEKSEHVLELMAPCYAAVRDKEGGGATYYHYVLDGDTLYAGLGMSGVRDDERTLGCMSVSMYELVDGSCTKWNKKSFPRKGEPRWEKEEGDCGYTEDGKTFYGDDTNSSRKIYGRQELEVHGDVLMTRQMKGNESKKVASLDEAIATQKKLIDEKGK